MKTKIFTTDNQTVLDHPYINDVLIYDIETDSVDVTQAKVVWFGAYSYKYGKYFILHGSEQTNIQKLLSEHKVLVGFNNKSFDAPILENNGYDINYKICFDCMRVVYNPDLKKTNRGVIIELPNGNSLEVELESHKLKDIAKALGVRTSKGEIDYKIFQQKFITQAQEDEIIQYLYQDVAATREIFEYFVKFFDVFKEFVDNDNIRKFDYIRSSLGSYTYSAICNLAHMPVVYSEDKGSMKYKGALVFEIPKEYAERVVALDFASLYPHCDIQNNLLSDHCTCCIPSQKWHGDGFFDEVQGYYCKKSLGNVEKILVMLLNKRLEYKKNKDPRQLPFKIALNTFYGLTGNKAFANFCGDYTAADCTAIGRKCISYAKENFEREGFTVLYGDTDSAFIELPPGKTKADLVIIADRIVADLKTHMPFPQDTWKFAVDNEIKKIWFHAKKNYVYITEQNKLKIKGLPIIKSDRTEIGAKILEIIRPQIIERRDIKFERKYFEDLIDELIKSDITLIGQVYNVRDPDAYHSKSSLHAQIAMKWGEGNHLLIPNKRLGTIGKKKHYAALDEIQTLTLSDLLLEKVWSELEVFIKE